MSEKTMFRTKVFVLAALILAMVASSGMTTETAYELPCVYRVEVTDQGDSRTDYGRLGTYNNVRWRTWAEFDISGLAGLTVTGVGFRVFNEWDGERISALRYSGIQPSAPSADHVLNSQHTFDNKYNGFDWDIKADGAWTPDEDDFFRPSHGQWEIWRRDSDNPGSESNKSLIKDIQAHIDEGRTWFAVEFDCLECRDSERVNLRFPDDPSDPASVYMEVSVLAISVNLGAGGDGGETIPLASSINFATGNKYKRESDLRLTGPGLPLAYTRHYNSQSEHDGILGYGWTGTFSETVAVTDQGMTLFQSDGAEAHFVADGSGKYVSVADRVRVIESESGGWKLTEPDGRTLTFDSNGKLVRIADRNGNSQTIGHADGKLAYVEDNYGRRLDFTYNADGRLETLTTPAGDFTYAYDANGNLTSVTRPDQTQRTYGYEDSNDAHNLTKVTDERGKSAVYAYDDQDRAVASEAVGGSNHVIVTYDSGTTRRVTDSEGNTTTYELQGANGIGRIRSSSGSCGECPGGNGAEYELGDRMRVSSRKDAKGNVTAYTYDDRGNVLTKKEAVGVSDEERTTTHTWDTDLSLVTSVTRASIAKPGENTVRSFEYDDKGNLKKITETGFSGEDALTRTVTMTHNAAGQMATIDGPRTDISDVVTFDYYANDASEGQNRGMLRKITDPLGHETLFADYNTHGKPEKITDANGTETVLAYDSAGRTTSRTVTGLTTTFEYDDAGNPTVVTLPGGRKITYAYNDSGQPVRMEDNADNYVAYEYDTRGNRTREEIRDESGVLKKYSDFVFDDLSRLEKIIHPGGHSENAKYDDNGNLTRTTDPNKKAVSYDYDHLDRLTGITQPWNLITKLIYDSHDNLTSVTDARSNVTKCVYDDLGRVVSATSPDTGTTAYGYDIADNLISRKDAKGITVSYEYDALNRLTRTVFPDASQDVTYGYDEGANGKGRLTSVTDPAGQTDYEYNALGQLIRETLVSDSMTFVTEYAYDPATVELSGMTYPSGMVIISYQRDENWQITSVSADGATLVQSMSYLPFGPVTGMTFGNNVLATSRAYDERYLMTAATSGAVMDYQYTHDPAGNVLSVSGVKMPTKVARGTAIYAHSGNRLGSIDGTQWAEYTYDGNGNATSDGTRTFEYDQNNRLVRVTQGGVTVGEYSYDGHGRRVRKTALGSVTLFHYDSEGNLIAETDGAGNPARDYIYLKGERIAMKVHGDQAGMYYFLNDHLGTPQKVADSSGNIVWEAAYLPFGEARIITETITNNFRFPGQYFDAETGLHYNWHRYYDPQTGRYLTPDPEGLACGSNLYQHALNSPANFADPNGGNPVAVVMLITGYYLLTNPDVAANAPDRCDDLYGSYGAGKMIREGIADIVVMGIVSKLAKVVPKGETYEVTDGVRRVKAEELLGNKVVLCQD